MTGEPGQPEKPQSPPPADAAAVAKRTAADAEAALRQFELDAKRNRGTGNAESREAGNLVSGNTTTDAIAEKPLASGNNQAAVQASSRSQWFKLRQPIRIVWSVGFGIATVLLLFGLWWFVTSGEASEDRIVSATTLPSPLETFGAFGDLWFEQALTRNAWVTIRRVAIGFLLAAIVGIPVGVLAGCFAALRAMLAPVVIFGRNIPLAALIPLTFFMFGIGETQKVMFIFLACVAFIIADATTAIMDVSEKYVDTAFTLGASRWQTIIKVLVPLAMPGIFNSLRLLFGLAFGYIMLAELVRMGDEAGGLGNLIIVAQRRGLREQIYLIILIIPVIALVIDRVLYWVQCQLFPYRYGSSGILYSAFQFVCGLWDDLKTSLLNPKAPFDRLATETRNLESDPAENGHDS